MPSEEIRVVIDGLEGEVEETVKRLALGVADKLRRAASEGGTPVHTGWARANWVPSVGGPEVNVVGSPDAVSDSAYDAGVAQVVTGYTTDKGLVFVSNNVPYIQRLNDGSSKQAPAGFVQGAIARTVEELRKR